MSTSAPTADIPRVRERRRRALALTPAIGVSVVLFGGALAGAVRSSLLAGGELDGELSLEAWRTVLADPAFGDALGFTARITVIATVLSAVIALIFAARLRGRGPLLRGLHSLPILVPHLVVAVVAVIWLGSGGLADRLLGGLPVALVRDLGGWGIVLVYVYKEVPFLTLLLLTTWDHEVAGREEAAAVLGAGGGQRFRFVVWPALRAPLGLGSLIVAAFTFGSFEVPLAVGPTYPPTLAVLALQQTQGALLAGQARAAALLLIAAGISVALATTALRQLRPPDRAP